MKTIQNFSAVVVPLDRSNIDTDSIIPKQYLKSIQRTGFGPYLFDEWRYLEQGILGENSKKRRKNSGFVLNDPRYSEAQILLTGENFGCGSSREHAVWSLLEYGIQAIIAPSFADIFYSNAFKNGLLLITLDNAIVQRLFKEVFATVGYQLFINLENMELLTPTEKKIAFFIAQNLQYRLLKGLDDIAITLELSSKIKEYERNKQQQAPWLFVDIH